MFKKLLDFFKSIFGIKEEEPDRPNIAPPIVDEEAPVEALPSDKYRVIEGDSLSAIAKKLSVSLDALIKANPQITDPAIIHVGDVLNLPQGAPPVVVPPVTVPVTKPAKLLWYPVATKVAAMPKRGTYKDGYPIGLIVHFNAGRNNAKGTIDYGRTQGYNYLAMDREGVIFQPNPLSDWGWHAGTSSWKIDGKTVTGVSSLFAGIEIAAAGQLTKLAKPEGAYKYKSWFGEKYTDDEVRYSEKNGNIHKGYYHKYTAKQEDALVEFILWLKRNNPAVFNLDYVLGHDEVAPTRKNDPGAALSMSMSEFRAMLKKRYEGK